MVDQFAATISSGGELVSALKIFGLSRRIRPALTAFERVVLDATLSKKTVLGPLGQRFEDVSATGLQYQTESKRSLRFRQIRER